MNKRETWIILGASSAIARALARKVAASGADVVLAGRDAEDLQRTAADLIATHGVEAQALNFEAGSASSRAALAEFAQSLPGLLTIVLLFGAMPPQAAIDAAPEQAAGSIDANFTWPVLTLHVLAPILEARREGRIIGVGSVAGDRGRLPNYVYGAAKSGFHTYLQGLRNRMQRANVQVITVKPGVVDTAMTWALPAMGLAAAPEVVAEAIQKASARGQLIVYTPWFWRFIMLIIRHLPERIAMRLNF